ncbi:hypothetical protein [Chachezhania sediminis]|uniref:hypothetical protein n=1 Tax=Chachezhania sediminis TaxID=2599291 RepID=UPI00131D27C3|nr:hypothetical protein [Chachezhania sediminis]
MNAAYLSVVGGDEDLPVYPFTSDDRLDSHWFMPWHRQRWLNSEMRLKGTPEARAYYFDLINISYGHSPIGTLPDDTEQLAKFAMCDHAHFVNLCRLPFGPLHRWKRCICDGDDAGEGTVRLYHPTVLAMMRDAMARKEDNRARNDRASASKRQMRLRSAVAGYHVDLSKNDAAVLWMDQWLLDEGCDYRSAAWIERAIGAWSNHMADLGLRRR